MNTFTKIAITLTATLLPIAGLAQSAEPGDTDRLKVTALEALMSAPPSRALPIVSKVLAGNHSDEVKARALFILGQLDSAEAQATLLQFARDGSGELRHEAIRSIGIGGTKEALSNLKAIYEKGDRDTKDAVLEAYLIAGDRRSVYDIAAAADNEEDFSEAVDMLGAMGARDELRQLRGKSGMSESLIEAYAVSGDIETLREVALNGEDPTLQAQAIEAMGIVGGSRSDATLMEIYRGAGSDDIREAALQGLLISGHDSGVLELYRGTKDTARKRQLLETLVLMNSDAVWDLIDSTLDSGQ